MYKFIKKKFNTLKNLTINPEIGYIYMLHRVGYQDQEKLFSNENMKISPEFLEDFIVNNLQSHQFISLDELCLIKAGKLKLKKKFIVMTLDDGYLDNYELAYPIFKKYNIPFAIYVASGLVDGSAQLWWYRLEELLLKNAFVQTGDGEKHVCESKEEKEKLFLKLRFQILDIKPDNFKIEIEKLLPGISEMADYYDLMMTREQISQISKDVLCTIGSHTVSHFNLSKLIDDQVLNDIRENKNVLKEITGKEIFHFAYPFGTANEVGDKTGVIAEKAGFKTITVANGGATRKLDFDLFNLKRLMLMDSNY